MRKSRGPKRPSFNEHLAALKNKPVGEPPDFSKRDPVWRFGLLQLNESPVSVEGGWKRYATAHADDVRAFLAEMEKLTWREIEAQTHGTKKGHRKHGFIEPDRICKVAQDCLHDRGLTDRAQGRLFKLRYASRGRVWGIREEEKFHLLWWDPEHKVYETEAD